MADHYGRYPHIECEYCHSLYPEYTWDSDRWTHKCDKTRSPCSECGLLHDGYSSSTTGVSPCFAAMKYRLDELTNALNIVLSIKTHGMNEDLFRAIRRGAGNPTEHTADSSGNDDKPHSEANLPET